MYLQANPGRGRTQEEQEDLKAKYKHGEQVLPRVTIERGDAADERMLAEVREMSLRELKPIEDGMDIDQDPRAHKPRTHGAHETTLGEFLESVPPTVTGHQRVQSNVITQLIRQYRGHVFLKPIRPPKINNGEHQASKEGKFRLLPAHLGEGPNLQIMLLGPLPTCQKDHLAQLRVRDLLGQVVKVEERPTQTMFTRLDQGSIPDLSLLPPTRLLLGTVGNP
ncbi:MAG: hypothetical protein Q9166_004251 [cf. Caloplaca sp. 2 TL-2023]